MTCCDVVKKRKRQVTLYNIPPCYINCQRSFYLKKTLPWSTDAVCCQRGANRQTSGWTHTRTMGRGHRLLSPCRKAWRESGNCLVSKACSSTGFRAPFRTALFLSVHNHQRTSARLNLYGHFPAAMQYYCLIILLIVITEGSPLLVLMIMFSSKHSCRSSF